MDVPFRMPTFDVDGPRAEYFEEEPYEPMVDCGQHDRDIDMLVAIGELHRCAVCGCTELTACPGGCVWATPTLCSRCVA